MNSSQAVIFDVAGVVVDWDLLRVLDPGEDDFQRFLSSPDWHRINVRVDAGATPAQALASEPPRLAVAYNEYLRRFSRTVAGTIPGTVALMEALRASGYRVCGLSNWGKDNFVFARQAAPILDCIEMVVSGEVGMAKPDRKIFEYAIAHFDIDPTKSVFIDDTAHNLPPAQQLGLRTIHFRSASLCALQLQELGFSF